MSVSAWRRPIPSLPRRAQTGTLSLFESRGLGWVCEPEEMPATPVNTEAGPTGDTGGNYYSWKFWSCPTHASSLQRPFSPGPGPFGAALDVAFLLCKESDSQARGRESEANPSLGPLIIETPEAIIWPSPTSLPAPQGPAGRRNPAKYSGLYPCLGPVRRGHNL